MKELKRTLALASILALAVFSIAADDKLDPTKLPPASTKTGLTYDTDIKPILDKSCVKCHSGDKAKGKLHLDTLAGIIKGGKDAPNIVPGKSEKSTSSMPSRMWAMTRTNSCRR